MITTLDRLFDNDKKILKRREALVDKIDSLQEEYRSYADRDLQSKTAWFRDRLA